MAAFEAPLAIGTDTGGSIRQPAAVTGTVGVKPTYGGVSRYGLVALASSLDQAGPCARTVLDAALLHEVIAGHDPRDSTVDRPPGARRRRRRPGARRRRPACGSAWSRELGGEGYQAGVQAAVRRGASSCWRAAAPRSSRCPARTSRYALRGVLPDRCRARRRSNLARFDAMRYGLRVGDDGDAQRRGGHGRDPRGRLRRRGQAAHHARHVRAVRGYYDAYYGQAQKVRTLIARDFAAAFEQVDVLVSPTTPTTAFRLGEQARRPAGDVPQRPRARSPPTSPATPGLSLPGGPGRRGRPAGRAAGDGPAMADERLYRSARRSSGAARALGRAACWTRHRRWTRDAGRRAMSTGSMTRPAEPVLDYDEALERFDPVLGLEVHVELNTATQDVLRLPDRVRRRAEHAGLPGVPGSARRPAGAQRHGRRVGDRGSAWR